MKKIEKSNILLFPFILNDINLICRHQLITMMTTKASKKGKIDMVLLAKQVDALVDGSSTSAISSSAKSPKRGKIDMELFAKQVDALIDESPSESVSTTDMVGQKASDESKKDSHVNEGNFIPRENPVTKFKAKPILQGKIDLDVFYRGLAAFQESSSDETSE